MPKDLQNKLLTPDFCQNKIPVLNLELEEGGCGTLSKDDSFCCMPACKLKREESIANSWAAQVQHHLFAPPALVPHLSLPLCCQLRSLCMIFLQTSGKIQKDGDVFLTVLPTVLLHINSLKSKATPKQLSVAILDTSEFLVMELLSHCSISVWG